MNTTTFEGWAILELMGHRRLAGKVSEVEVFGGKMLRIDIPSANGDAATQFYGITAIYCLTPTTEEVARAVAQSNQPEPVHRWELAKPIDLPPQMDPLYDPYEKADDGDDNPTGEED